MRLRSAGVILAATVAIATLAPANAADYLGPIDQQRSYSSGVVTQGGKTVWLAGMGGVTGPGGKKNTDFASQTRQVFENIAATLKEAGGTLDNVVTMTVMIRNQSDGAEFLKLRGEVFKQNFPASMLIVAKDFANPNLLLEIQAVAVIPKTKKPKAK
jgi:2-iminobutanoate/2-iminopropanoate deaminase